MTMPTILFVDDESNILKSLQRLFLDEEYEVVTAESGKAALEMIEGGMRPTVIVSDQRMPEMNGAEFLARAKEIAPESIRMVLTGYADINAAVNAINQGGIYRYILKPWNDDDLKLSIHEAIKRYNLVRENQRLTEELTRKNQELAQLNDQLEKKVEERTSELRRKVKELKGRDRIQQYLLEIHPLPELLNTVLEVVIDVLAADGAAFYLRDRESGELVNSAAINLEDAGRPDITGAIDESAVPDGAPGRILTLAERDFTVVPVQKDKKVLGVLLVRARPAARFSENDLQTVTGFGRQAAIGINDSRLRENFDDLETSLDDILAAI